MDVPIELFHHMQRFVDPLVKLTTLEEIEEFMDTKQGGVWKGDKSGNLLMEGEMA